MAEVAAALAEVDTALPVARLRGEMLARAWAYLTARLTMLAVWQREAAERKRREFFAALAASERARDKPAPVVVVEVWSPLHRFLTSGGLGRCVLHPFSGLSNWEAGRQEAATFLHGKGKLTYLATIADANAMIAELNRSAGGSLGDPRSMLDDDTRAVVQVPELKPGDLFFFGQFAGVVLYAGVHTSHFTRVLSMGRNEPWIEHGLPAITPAVET